jgi:hypothetical protein
MRTFGQPVLVQHDGSRSRATILVAIVVNNQRGSVTKLSATMNVSHVGASFCRTCAAVASR